MHKPYVAAVMAVAAAFAAPAAAQELPLNPGNYWDVSGITVDDGHMGDYADYLAGQYRQQQEYAKSKGWIKGYYILRNANKRVDEPDLYLVRIMDHVPGAAESMAHDKEMNAFLKSDARKMLAGSGARAHYRKLSGSELLQEMTWAH